MSTRLRLAAAALAVGALAACAAPTTPGGAATDGPTGTVTVLAAASLTESFDAIAAAFEAGHPGVTVEISYGSSATLVQQVTHGAPASVLALAGEAAAKPLDRSLVKDQRVFATNVLEIAVPPTNPAGIKGIDDLGRPGLKVVLCGPTVPCGMAADATFAKAGITPSVVSREIDVKATLAKVRLGEADAAVVYHSDVVAAKGAVTGIEIPATVNSSLRYPVIRLDDEPATRAFVDYLFTSESRATLTDLGLGAP
jgi:molybdate transport system substrate-binding protein